MIRDTSKETKKKYNYVYKLTLKSNPEIFYIGKRSTNNENDDEYMGSGKALKEYKLKYGEDCFNKEILSYWDTSEEALIEEQRLVTKELIQLDNCLNRIVGGGNFDTLGCKWGKRTEEQNQRNRESHLGKKHSEETKKKRSISMKKKWQDKDFIEKRKNCDKTKLRKHLEKISKDRKGKVCIIKDKHWKYIKQDELDFYLKNGWKKRGVQNKPTYDEILEYRNQGLTYSKIAKIYNVTESCVRNWKNK